jgi:hypothetical protein
MHYHIYLDMHIVWHTARKGKGKNDCNGPRSDKYFSFSVFLWCSLSTGIFYGGLGMSANFDLTKTPRRASRYYQSYDKNQRNQTRDIVVTTENLPVPEERPRTRKRVHWLLPVGVGMLVMLCLYAFFVEAVIPRYTALLDRWNYGVSHTSHVHTSVYAGKSSDIYAFSVQDITVVTVITNSKVQVYEVALQADVVLISVSDIAEKNDLVVSNERSGVAIVLYNNGNGFQSTPPQKKG